jgi:hypothetical protein
VEGTRCEGGGKYKYHRIYVTNDLIALNENTQLNHSNIMTTTLLSKKHSKSDGNGVNGVNNNKGLLNDKKDNDKKGGNVIKQNPRT